MTKQELLVIESKLHFGVQTFTASEVASLLNTIRIQKETIKKFMKEGTK